MTHPALTFVCSYTACCLNEGGNWVILPVNPMSMMAQVSFDCRYMSYCTQEQKKLMGTEWFFDWVEIGWIWWEEQKDTTCKKVKHSQTIQEFNMYLPPVLLLQVPHCGGYGSCQERWLIFQPGMNASLVATRKYELGTMQQIVNNIQLVAW